MEQATLVDTNVLIDFLRGKDTSILEHQETGIHISTITSFELLFGALKSQKAQSNLEQVKKLIKRVHVHAFTDKSASLAAQIHAELTEQGTPIDIRDLFIAATAIENELSIRTNNKKHFTRIPGLEIL